jgi:hypothetical protein
MQLDFTNDEMRNFILKTGKYKITNIKCLTYGFLQGYEVDIEVAYPIDDFETEKWIMSISVQPILEICESPVLDPFKILNVFQREFKSKLLNL